MINPSDNNENPSPREGHRVGRKLRTIEMNRISIEEFREAEKMPLIVVLDDVRSMYNIVLRPVRPIRRFTRQPWVLRIVSDGAISRLPRKPWNNCTKTVISCGVWSNAKGV